MLTVFKNKKIKEQSGFALLGVIFIVLFLSLVLAAAFIRSEFQQRFLITRIALQEALNSAEAGVERAIMELRRNRNWGNIVQSGINDFITDVELCAGVLDTCEVSDPDKLLGYFSVATDVGQPIQGWDSRLIRSVGMDSTKKIIRVVMARVRVEDPTRFLISTLGELVAVSGAQIDDDILGQDIFFDVNHSNPNLNERLITINGDVLYTRSVNFEQVGDLGANVIISGKLEEIPSITFPGVDLEFYSNLAQDVAFSDSRVYLQGNQTIDVNNLDQFMPVNFAGPEFLPELVFVDGDVSVSGKYNHSMLIVASGDLFISDDVVAPFDLSEEAKPQLGLFAARDIIIDSNDVGSDEDLTIEGFLLADGQGDAEGRLYADASPGTLGDLIFKGAVSARGIVDKSTIELNAFKSRQYLPNNELTDNRKIPFVPFIVNLAEWREVDHPDKDAFPAGW